MSADEAQHAVQIACEAITIGRHRDAMKILMEVTGDMAEILWECLSRYDTCELVTATADDVPTDTCELVEACPVPDR